MALSAAQIKNTIPKYCAGRIEDIECYALAVASPEKYACHHRMEIQPDGTKLSKKWMIEHGIYYNLDPCMLILMSEKEHKALHSTGRRIKWSVDSRKKLSISRSYENGFSRRFRDHFGFGSETNASLYRKEKKFYRYYGFCSWEGKKPESKQFGPHPERGDTISIAKLKTFGKLYFERTGRLPKEDMRHYKRCKYRYTHNIPVDWGI